MLRKLAPIIPSLLTPGDPYCLPPCPVSSTGDTKVYEGILYGMGLVLLAETSNTRKYLRDYTGLNMEVTVEEQYREALEIIYGWLEPYVQGCL